MLICDQCTKIRGLVPSNVQDRITCDVCGEKSLCSDTLTLPSPELAFAEKGFFNSKDLSELLALIKGRKAVLLPRIKFLQTEISKPMVAMKEGELVYLMECLTEEGLAKKAVNTCHSVFKRMKELLSKVNLSDAERSSKTVIVQNLLAELHGLNEKEKEMSILYKNALDQILITQLRYRVTGKQFDIAVEESKKIYHQING